MRRSLILAASAAVFALGAGAGFAQDKKQLVIVVKGLDNPFFEAINQGCQKWNSENADSEYECFYTGPASTSDEAGEAQIVQDMLGKPTTVAMAISPSKFFWTFFIAKAKSAVVFLIFCLMLKRSP